MTIIANKFSFWWRPKQTSRLYWKLWAPASQFWNFRHNILLFGNSIMTLLCQGNSLHKKCSKGKKVWLSWQIIWFYFVSILNFNKQYLIWVLVIFLATLERICLEQTLNKTFFLSLVDFQDSSLEVLSIQHV